MRTCPKCNAPAEGRFCGKCGSLIGDADAGTGSANPSGWQQQDTQAAVAGPMADNVACALCYLLWGVTGILFLVLEPYNRKRAIRFHAFQSIFFTVAMAIAWIVVITIGSMLAYIPWIGALIASFLFLALFFGAFLCWLWLMYKAYNSQPAVLPVIGTLAEKQA